MDPDTKRAELLSRISHLSEQLDFLANERTKLVARKKAQEDAISTLSHTLLPNLILVQTLILAWFEQMNDMDEDIVEHLVQKMEEKFSILLDIFANFLGIVKLRVDIEQSKNTEKYSTQLTKFNANLIATENSRKELKKNLFSELYFQYNLAIDEKIELFQRQFQEIIKLLDAFQLQVTKLHGLLPDDIIQGLNEFPIYIQELEEAIDIFRKTIHLNGEPLITRMLDQFDDLLHSTLTKTTDITPILGTSVDFLDQQYQLFDEIKTNFVQKIWEENDTKIYALTQNLNEQIDAFVQYINRSFDIIHDVKVELDPILLTDLATVEKKIEELTEKIVKLKSTL